MKQEYQGYTGVWRRLKSGAAIFIRDGEDIKSAVRRNYNSQSLENKRLEIAERDVKAFEEEQRARREKMIAFREKGELSKEYDEAFAKERKYKQEQDKLRQQRYDIEDEQQRVTSRNRFGMKIRKDQLDKLREVGNVKKSLADLRKAVKEHNSKKDLGSEIELGEQKNKFADKYGYETMKDEIASVNNSLGGYKYYTKHGMGPGAVPTDVKISNIKDYDDGMTSFETNRPLSSKELNFYSIENEIKNAEYDAKYGHNSTSDSKIKNYTNSSVQDLRKAMRNMKPYEEEIQIGGRVITKTSNGYGVRNQYDYDDPMTDYSAYVYGFKEKWIIDEAVKKGELKQTELKAKVERFRERKGTSSSNNNGSVESLSKQALIERIVDDQISRGVVKAENRALQIRARQNMTKSELLKYFK